MAKLLIVNKSEGPVRINKIGYDSLVIKPGKQEMEEGKVAPYRDEIMSWCRAGVLEVKAVEGSEGASQASPASSTKTDTGRRGRRK